MKNILEPPEVHKSLLIDKIEMDRVEELVIIFVLMTSKGVVMNPAKAPETPPKSVEVRVVISLDSLSIDLNLEEIV